MNPIAYLFVGASLIAIGAMLGAWLSHRARMNLSPIPSVKLPERKKVEPPKPQAATMKL